MINNHTKELSISVRLMIASGKKVDAIKRHVKENGGSLKQAKTAIDLYEEFPVRNMDSVNKMSMSRVVNDMPFHAFMIKLKHSDRNWRKI